MNLPFIITNNKEFMMLQTKWASQINPLFNVPLNNGLLLKNVVLNAGSNEINHLLGRKLIGWVPVRMHGAFSQIYDDQDDNQRPELTLTLVSSNTVVVDLYVF